MPSPSIFGLVSLASLALALPGNPTAVETEVEPGVFIYTYPPYLERVKEYSSL
jgi:hypothetical protein